MLQAVRLGYRAIALIDEYSLAGVVRAHEAAWGQDIKLIIGAEFQLEGGHRLSTANGTTSDPSPTRWPTTSPGVRRSLSTRTRITKLPPARRAYGGAARDANLRESSDA